MENLIQNLINTIPETQAIVFQSVLIVIGLWIIRTVILKLTVVKIQNDYTRYIWRQIVQYTVIILSVVLLIRIWFTGIQPILTFLGLISVAITIILKEPIQNLFAWVTIIWRELFSVGDRIEIGKYKGDVVGMGFFYFTLMEIGQWVDADQSTGRLLKVPNGIVITEGVANYSRGLPYVWNEIPVMITGDSNWKSAKSLLLSITEKHSETLSDSQKRAFREKAEAYVISPTLTPTVYTSIEEKGILLTIRHLCEPRLRRNIEENISENILEVFRQHSDINLLYRA